MEIKRIGFIGTGVMGAPMAEHLLQAGFELQVYTRTKARAEHLISLGATWCDSPALCARDCDVVISMVGYPEDVREVWMSHKGAFTTMKQGAIGVDMTTSLPKLAQELYAYAKDHGFEMADCPVTGGDIGARNASLTLLFGGDKETFEKLQPVFKAISKLSVYFGEAGNGQLAKASNQIAVATTMFSTCESIIFSRRMGLDTEKLIETLSSGAAGSFSLKSYGPRILNKDYEPGFKINHFIKDMEIALKVCNERGISLPGLELAHKSYKMLKELKQGEKGTQALYMLYNSDYLGAPQETRKLLNDDEQENK